MRIYVELQAQQVALQARLQQGTPDPWVMSQGIPLCDLCERSGTAVGLQTLARNMQAKVQTCFIKSLQSRSTATPAHHPGMRGCVPPNHRIS